MNSLLLHHRHHAESSDAHSSHQTAAPSSVAAVIERRRVLRGLGAIGLAIATGTASLLGRFADPALAHGDCNTAGGMCGPSPKCTSTQCVDGGCGYLRRGPYGQSASACTTSTQTFWIQCDCRTGCAYPAQRGMYQCNDCCAPNQGYIATCTGTSGLINCAQLWRCICRKKLASCPTSCPFCGPGDNGTDHCLNCSCPPGT